MRDQTNPTRRLPTALSGEGDLLQPRQLVVSGGHPNGGRVSGVRRVWSTTESPVVLVIWCVRLLPSAALDTLAKRASFLNTARRHGRSFAVNCCLGSQSICPVSEGKRQDSNDACHRTVCAGHRNQHVYFLVWFGVSFCCPAHGWGNSLVRANNHASYLALLYDCLCFPHEMIHVDMDFILVTSR